MNQKIQINLSFFEKLKDKSVFSYPYLKSNKNECFRNFTRT